MTPELTIGMATYNDYEGVYFTVQALRLYHTGVLKHCELVIVDNNPDSPQGRAVAEFCRWLKGDFQAVRYLRYRSSVSTSGPKNHVFQAARGRAVLCLDCHVLLAPDSIARLLDYYRAVPESKDLLSGPILWDDLSVGATHLDDVWRGHMWGIWALDERGRDRDSPPFPIPAMGMGCFSCSKQAWLGYNPTFRGFGGEEWYIHSKFRKAGRQCLCLPYLRWLHRFAKAQGERPPTTPWHKCRNYVIGLTELGIPLDRMYRHFVKGLNEDGSPLKESSIPEQEWQLLLSNPNNPPELPGGTPGVSQPPVLIPAATTVPVFTTAVTTPSAGPGTELTNLLKQLGIGDLPGCDCKRRAAQMDSWGVAGCREHREDILTWLQQGQERWGWKDKLLAATRALTTGLVFRLNPLDPFPGLVDEAIRLAEQQSQSQSQYQAQQGGT